MTNSKKYAGIWVHGGETSAFMLINIAKSVVYVFGFGV